MPQTVENYLNEGTISPQIYLLCYIEPLSGYAIAKRRYGIPSGAKIYGYTKVMIEKGYLEHKEIVPKLGGTFRSLVAPLVKEIDIELNLHRLENKALTRFLDSDTSRNAWRFFKPNDRALRSNLNVVELVRHRLVVDAWLALNSDILQGLHLWAKGLYPPPPTILLYNKAFRKLPKSLLTKLSSLASISLNLSV